MEEKVDPHLIWIETNRPLADFAFGVFMSTGKWPKVAAARRHFARLRQPFDVQAAADARPRHPGEMRQLHDEHVRLSMRELRYVPNANPLIQVCLAIARRAAAAYVAPGDDEYLTVTSDDPSVKAMAGNDRNLLYRAADLLLESEHPSPIAGGGRGDDGWSLTVNEPTVMDFENVASAADFIAVQDKIIDRDWTDRRGSIEPAQQTPARIFVLMPFGPMWSRPVYETIQGCVTGWPDPPIVTRADDLTRPGRITEQIMEEIQLADAIVADITGLNGNVMWELGYAYAYGKPTVILNQDIAASPFDLYDHRQLQYDPSVPGEVATTLAAFLQSALATRDA